MELSNDLISSFVKAATSDVEDKKETTAYGTAVVRDGSTYVVVDGSELETPVKTSTTVQNGDRVMVRIKNHSAIVTDNLTSPSVGQTVVKEMIDVEKIRVDELVAENATIKDKLSASEAEISDIKANNITVDEKLSAAEADIKSLKADKVDATTLESTYAKIKDLEATNVDIDNLEADHASFKETTTEKLEAAEADIEKLETDKLSATDADIKYASIDFANIGEAALKKIFAESGLIKDITVGDGTITGKLVGVTITGDLIEGNTVKADKLVVLGEDGLYYKLNVTAGGIAEGEEVPTDSLHGSVITANSITAEKINVKDLVAFGATIGGFNITEKALYSGAKSAVDNTTDGMYLDSEGQFYISGGNSYIKFYKNKYGNYQLDICAFNLRMSTISGGIKTVEGAIIDAKKEAVDKAETAQTAAEIAQSKADEASTKADTAQSTADTASAAASNAQSTADEASTKAETAQSKADEASTKADTAQSTADAAQESVDNLEIGGRNILYNSSFSENFDEWTTTTDCDIMEEDGYKCGHITGFVGEIRYCLQSLVEKLESRQVYTISAWVKAANIVEGTTNPLLALYHDGYYDLDGTSAWFGYGAVPIPRTGEWVHITKTITTDDKLSTATSYNFYIYARDLTGDLYFRNLKIEKGNKATDWTPAPEDVSDQIIDSSDQVRQELVEAKADLAVIAEGITAEALKSYVKSDGYEEFKETTKSSLSLLSESLDLNFNKTTERINGVDSDLQEKFNTITKYFTFNINGLEIGQTDSPYKMVLDNDRFSMFMGDVEVLWIDAETKEVHTPKLAATERVMMVGYKAEEDADGNLNWDYIGG